MNVIFGGNIRYEGGDYGNAVLSRLPIKQHKNHLLPLFDDGEKLQGFARAGGLHP